MASRIYTYSIMEEDKENIERVKKLKQYSLKTGISMSYIILKGLEYYERNQSKAVRSTNKQS